jgi:hypothetical protein
MERLKIKKNIWRIHLLLRRIL